MQKYILIFSLSILFENGACIFGDRLKNIKDKAKTFFKSKFGKDKKWHFLGHDITEFPGSNQKYKEANKQKWNEYYNCLKQQQQSLGSKNTVTPEAIQGFSGHSVKCICKLCLSPKERININSIVWDFAGLDDNELKPLEFTENVFMSPEDKALHLYNLQEEHSGQYQCRLGHALTAPYFLTVANISESFDEVHSNQAPHGPYPKFPTNIPEYNVIASTEWGPWSPCSKCGKVGKKHRLGYCIINIRESNNKKAAEAHSNTTTDMLKVKDKGRISETDLGLLYIFTMGIPCRSHILPDELKNLKLIKNRKHEIMTGLCKESCPELSIFEIKDKNGKVIEKANNSAGIYSMLQGLPPIEPAVERRLQYERKGSNIFLTCPGNLNSDTPVQWQIGSKNLIPDIIYKESQGRVAVTLMDKISIKKAKIHDSNIYSCWQNNELAGVIRLVVEKKLKLNFNHHIMLFGLVIILSTFVFVFVKAFFGRKYAKT